MQGECDRGSAGGRLFGVVAVAAVAGLAGLAWGQPAERPPLQGPAVEARRVPGVEPRFGEPMEGEGRGRREMPPRVFQDALNELRGEGAPAAVRLTAEQEKKIDALLEDYRQTVRAHVQERRDAMGEGDREELRRVVRERRQGDNPGAAPRPDGPDTPAGPIRERVAELRRGMPAFSDWQVKIWAELNEPQRAAIEARMAEARDRMEERQGREYLERRIRQRQPGGEAGPGPQRPAAGGPAPAPAPQERIRRLAQRLQELPPEEQDRILMRLEDELDRRARLREGRPPVDPRPEGPGPGGGQAPPRRQRGPQ